MRPVKQVLQTYASKWMFTYTKYLSDQVNIGISFLAVIAKFVLLLLVILVMHCNAQPYNWVLTWINMDTG